jgi:hypothetical protein
LGIVPLEIGRSHGHAAPLEPPRSGLEHLVFLSLGYQHRHAVCKPDGVTLELQARD